MRKATLLAALLLCLPASAAVLPLVPTFIAGAGGGGVLLSITITAENSGFTTGWSDISGLGSVDPTSPSLEGYDLELVYTVDGAPDIVQVTITDGGATAAQSLFSSVHIYGGAVDMTLDTASASSFTQSSGFTSWQWNSGITLLSDSVQYTVDFL